MTPLPVQPDATVRPAALASVWYLRSWRGHHRRSRPPVTTRPGVARRRGVLAPHERELALERVLAVRLPVGPVERVLPGEARVAVRAAPGADRLVDALEGQVGEGVTTEFRCDLLEPIG